MSQNLPKAPHAKDTAFCISLPDALKQIDRTFGIDSILAEEGQDIVSPYYIQSQIGYRRVHSQKGCIHVALNVDGRFHPDGFLTQSREVAAQIKATRATKVLEMGCGMGFNILTLAPDHPDVDFTGLDLLDHHIRTATSEAKGLGNVRFRVGTHENVSAELYGVEVVFGIETLCHASDLDAVARHVAAALVPGGRFVMYDGFRRPNFHNAPPDVITAARLFEVTTAVKDGFRRIEDWQAALERAGLVILRTEDLTEQSIAGMRVLQLRAARFFTSWKYRILRHVMPKYLIRNAVAALIGPFMIEGAGPRSGDTQACLSYSLLIAEKPV
jgi:arsenite methyltransferase